MTRNGINATLARITRASAHLANAGSVTIHNRTSHSYSITELSVPPHQVPCSQKVNILKMFFAPRAVKSSFNYFFAVCYCVYSARRSTECQRTFNETREINNTLTGKRYAFGKRAQQRAQRHNKYKDKTKWFVHFN